MTTVVEVPVTPGEQLFVEVGGATLGYVEVGQADAPPIVFLHGGGPGCSSWLDWRQVGVDLAADYRCVFLDLAQYGASSYEPITGGFFATQARFVDEAMSALGIGAAHFVCQSLGSAVALRLAADSPDRVLSLSMTGATPVPYGVVSVPSSGKIVATALPAFYSGDGSMEARMRTLLADLEWFDSAAIPDELIRERARLSQIPEALTIAEDSTLRGQFDDVSDALDRIQVPVLLAYGDSDPFAPPEVPLHLFLRLTNAHLVLFKNASHHFPEEDPGAFLMTYRSWLTQQTDISKGSHS